MGARVLTFDIDIMGSALLEGRVSMVSDNEIILVAGVVGEEVELTGASTLFGRQLKSSGNSDGRNGSCVKSVKEWAPMPTDSDETALGGGALLSKDAAQARKLFVEDSSSIAHIRYLYGSMYV